MYFCLLTQSFFFFFFFFFNDTATTEIYTLSLHDALPIFYVAAMFHDLGLTERYPSSTVRFEDRKSTRLNSSHVEISYAVFCLKKKKKTKTTKQQLKREQTSHNITSH